MGRPLEKEIAEISHTLQVVFDQSVESSLAEMIDKLSGFPLLVVGSGGSLSAAHFVVQLHEKTTGHVAKAITPLELAFSAINPKDHSILFLTARGNNKDIINSLELAINREFSVIGIVCAQTGSKIIEKTKDYQTQIYSYEYDNPAGKDGFLAVNSLLSTCVLLGMGYGMFNSADTSMKLLQEEEGAQDILAIDNVLGRRSIVALGGDWAWPVVIDLESKFTEAALGNILPSDLRNFGHGRHHWFDKKRNESSLLVLETPSTSKMVKKIVSLLISEIPCAVLSTNFNGPAGTIDLFKKMFYFVNSAGKRTGIDPGRPGVPEFGRRIYHMTVPKSSSNQIIKARTVWIERKARLWKDIEKDLAGYLDEFLKCLKETAFSGVVFDYDGTLCNPCDRYTHPQRAIGMGLMKLCAKHISVGIASGRGKSLQKALRQVIEMQYWDSIIIGNYNGSVILPLSKELPNSSTICCDSITQAFVIAEKDILLNKFADIEVREKQISIIPKSYLSRGEVLNRILEIFGNRCNLKILESAHSIDIIDANVSKTLVVDAMRNSVSRQDCNILVVGDQGQYRGNDFEMLDRPNSLSVDRISSSPYTCWNLSPIGIRGAEAVITLMKAFEMDDHQFIINTKSLERQGKE